MSELWYTEEHSDFIRFSIKIKEQLYSGKSEFQDVEVFETEALGRLLTLDGLVMTTEYDEFVYHEMISHVPAFTHKNPKRALVIGGGDGGTIRELAKHESLEEIILCEIDKDVVEVSRKYLPTISAAIQNPSDRIKVVYEDGFKFIKQYKDYFDIIIVDSTDPIGPGKILFSPEFYKLIFEALTDDGIMSNQSENPWYERDILNEIAENMKAVFPLVKYYNVAIPTYPSGYWTLGFASKGLDPEKPCGLDRFDDQIFQMKYYTPQMHTASFALPAFQKKIIEGI